MKQARYYFLHDRKKNPHRVAFYSDDGKRTFKNFPEKKQALAFIVDCNSKNLLPQDLQFSVQERMIFARIKKSCQDSNISLQKIASFIEEQAHLLSSEGKPWNEALTAFLSDVEKRGCRPSSLRFYKTQVSLFDKRENPENIAQITQERAENYLADCNSPEHAKRALRAFFNFCKDNRWINVNPFELAKTPKRIKEKELPHVLTVEQIKTIFKNVPADWQPVFALLAFCGVRPNEIVPAPGKGGLSISSIDFKSKRISIPAEIAKTRTARIFEPPSNVWSWLEPLKGLNGKKQIAPGSYEVFRRIKDNCGVKIPHDALRHSFGSYGYHYLGAERTVEIMGHVGGFSVFAKHYKGLATPQDAKQYFILSPTD